MAADDHADSDGTYYSHDGHSDGHEVHLVDDDDEDGESEEDSDASSLSEGEIAEAAIHYAKILKKKNLSKDRGFQKNITKQPFSSSIDRKKSSTCKDCGKPGHWKGDPQCPEVVAGRTKPFKPAERKPDGFQSRSP